MNINQVIGLIQDKQQSRKTERNIDVDKVK